MQHTGELQVGFFIPFLISDPGRGRSQREYTGGTPCFGTPLPLEGEAAESPRMPGQSEDRSFQWQ